MRRLALLVLPVVAGLALVVAAIPQTASDGRPIVPTGVPVSRPFAVDETTVESCGTSPRCLDQALGNIAAASGPEIAWDELSRLIDTGVLRANECHLTAHRIGAGTSIWAGREITRVLAHYRASCADGFIHGAMDTLLDGLGASDTDGMAARLLDACGDAEAWPNDFERANCTHGAGHALMLHSGYDLPLSLETCRLAFPTDPPEQRGSVRMGCINGAFMENYNPSYDVVGRWLDYADPYAACDQLSIVGDELASCWIHATYALKSTYLENGDDVEGFAGACNALEPAPRANCYIGLGRELGMYERDPSFVARACELGRANRGEIPCIFQAAYQRIFLLRGTMADPAMMTRRLCASIGAGPVAEACWRGIGHAIYTDPSHQIVGSATDRCRQLQVPEGMPLDLCVRQASGEFYTPVTQ